MILLVYCGLQYYEIMQTLDLSPNLLSFHINRNFLRKWFLECDVITFNHWLLVPAEMEGS